MLHARTQVNVLLIVVLEARSSPELVDLITNKCVPFGKTARMAGTYRKQMQPCIGLLIYSKNTFCQGVSNDRGSHVETSSICAVPLGIIYVVPPQSWGDRSDTKHSKCLLLGGRRLNQLTLIPKPKGSGGARAATAQVGPANNRNDTKRCLPVEASLRPGEAVPW